MAPDTDPIPDDALTVVPANEASWEDITAVFGTGDAGKCACQRFKVVGWIWRDSTQGERTAALRAQTGCDNPNAASTSGLIGYLSDEPVGWVAVEPRIAYPKLRSLRIPWTGRPGEDRDDDGVWAVTCFAVRKGYRGRGLTYPLARAAVEYAREHGARAIEAYAMFAPPGKVITWGEMHVGARQVYEEAGFVEISRTARRAVMRIDF